MDGEVMLGSSAPIDAVALPDGPDIEGDDDVCPVARRLFRALDGDCVSCLTEASAVAGDVWDGEVPELGSSSCLSTRLDIDAEV